jgi:hypothetical protein
MLDPLSVIAHKRCTIHKEQRISHLLSVHQPSYFQNGKAELAANLYLRSSAIFPEKTRRFPSPSHAGFGFIGRFSLD